MCWRCQPGGAASLYPQGSARAVTAEPRVPLLLHTSARDTEMLLPVTRPTRQGSHTRPRARVSTRAKPRLRAALLFDKEKRPEAQSASSALGTAGCPSTARRAPTGPRKFLRTNQIQHCIPIHLQTGPPDTGMGTTRGAGFNSRVSFFPVALENVCACIMG